MVPQSDRVAGCPRRGCWNRTLGSTVDGWYHLKQSLGRCGHPPVRQHHLCTSWTYARRRARPTLGREAARDIPAACSVACELDHGCRRKLPPSARLILCPDTRLAPRRLLALDLERPSHTATCAAIHATEHPRNHAIKEGARQLPSPPPVLDLLEIVLRSLNAGPGCLKLLHTGASNLRSDSLSKSIGSLAIHEVDYCEAEAVVVLVRRIIRVKNWHVKVIIVAREPRSVQQSANCVHGVPSPQALQHHSGRTVSGNRLLATRD
mmetsp:Transcript_45431/g.97042  ORF Transcript_45431/g.97042 Transcript_45431/m.97042 type:complete len:264 (-) Transcript_45431:391-1182(-)